VPLRLLAVNARFCVQRRMNLLFLAIGCGLFFGASALPVTRLTGAELLKGLLDTHVASALPVGRLTGAEILKGLLGTTADVQLGGLAELRRTDVPTAAPSPMAPTTAEPTAAVPTTKPYWAESPWGACSATCGTGLKYRQVTCTVSLRPSLPQCSSRKRSHSVRCVL
jgi:hypothetical protein